MWVCATLLTIACIYAVGLLATIPWSPCLYSTICQLHCVPSHLQLQRTSDGRAMVEMKMITLDPFPSSRDVTEQCYIHLVSFHISQSCLSHSTQLHIMTRETTFVPPKSILPFPILGHVSRRNLTTPAAKVEAGTRARHQPNTEMKSTTICSILPVV